MASTSNIPKHGDPIIEERTDSLGAKKLSASRQFQQFLDQLGGLFDQTSTSSDDVIQLLSSNVGEIGILKAENARLSKINACNSQSLANMEAILGRIISEGRIMNKRIDEVEQLINGH